MARTEKRAALYLRTSTDDQHPENQLPELQQYAQARRMQLVDQYVDHGESGDKAQRPEIDRLMADARRRRFEVVLCWSISRFGRDMVGSVLTMHELTELGIELIFLQESIDTGSIVGRGIAALLSALAEQDLAERRARVRAGVKRARANGQQWGRPRLHQVDASQVGELRAQGLSYSRIADQLGVPKTTLYRQFVTRSENPAGLSTETA